MERSPFNDPSGSAARQGPPPAFGQQQPRPAWPPGPPPGASRPPGPFAAPPGALAPGGPPPGQPFPAFRPPSATGPPALQAQPQQQQLSPPLQQQQQQQQQQWQQQPAPFGGPPPGLAARPLAGPFGPPPGMALGPRPVMPFGPPPTASAMRPVGPPPGAAPPGQAPSAPAPRPLAAPAATPSAAAATGAANGPVQVPSAPPPFRPSPPGLAYTGQTLQSSHTPPFPPPATVPAGPPPFRPPSSFMPQPPSLTAVGHGGAPLSGPLSTGPPPTTVAPPSFGGSPPPPPIGGIPGPPHSGHPMQQQLPQQPPPGMLPPQQTLSSPPLPLPGIATSPAQQQLLQQHSQQQLPPPPQQQQLQQQQQQLEEEFQSLTVSMTPGSAEAAVEPTQLPRPSGPYWASEIPQPFYSTNAHPRFFRATTNAIPESQALRARWHLPLGAVVHPLAPTPPGEEVPVVDFGRCGIVRCRRCRTYINPFVQFVDGGRRWRCNVCSLLNDIPQEYFCGLDANGRRTDWESRPELRSGSVEFVAPVEYMVRPPMPPAFFFLIDVSVANAQSGMLQVIADSARACLDSLPGDSRARIGFLAFDSSLHFFSLRASATQPHMLVMSDLDDPFLPVPEEELLVNLAESRAAVEALLDALPSMFAKSRNVESALGPALKATFQIMSQLGGKVLLFQSALPSLGIGRLRLRGSDARVYGTDREHTLRIADDGFYKAMAADCSRQQIAFSVYSFPTAYCDLASVGTLARYTGGQVVCYPNFRLANDGDRFRDDLKRDLTRETAWESVMRIRCGKGLKIGTFHGHFFIRSSDLLALPAVDCDKAFAVQITHEEAVLANNATAYLQCALLYTSSSGERRIRVHTMALPVVRDIAEMYRNADGEATATVLTKIALDKVLGSRLEDARQLVQQKVVASLKEYRNLFASLLSRHNQPHQPRSSQFAPPPPGTPYSTQPQLPHQRLIFPPSLRLIPLLALGLLKSPMLRGGFADMGADARSAALYTATCAPVELTLRLLHPLLLQIDRMPAEAGTTDASTGATILPPMLPPSASSLDGSGAFVLDDGTSIQLWLGSSMQPALATQMVGADALTAADISLVPFVPQANQVSQRLAALLESLRHEAGKSSLTTGTLFCKPIRLRRQGGMGEGAFFASLTEDRSSLGLSYGEFVAYLFRQVQMK